MSDLMQLATYLEPDAFLSIVQEGLERHEARNSLMLGNLLHMRGDASSARQSPVLISVQHDGSWCLAGMMTPPYPVVLAAASDDAPREALVLLVQDLIDSRRSVSGVVATPPLARAFAERWTAVSGHRVQRTVRMRMYALVTVDSIPAVSGQLRRAAADDAELVGQWFAEFESELNLPDAGGARDCALQRLHRNEIYLLEDVRPRTIVARARPTRNTITVNAVYTPPAWRRRGFATAAVAALSRELLGEGFSICVLYTDLVNPTSNSIYQRIGYRPVSDSEHIVFTGAHAAALRTGLNES